jgi:hypothetical protein
MFLLGLSSKNGKEKDGNRTEPENVSRLDSARLRMACKTGTLS